VSEVLKDRNLAFVDLSERLPREAEQFRDLLLEDDYSRFILDLDYLPWEPTVTANLFARLKNATSASVIFFAQGYPMDGKLIGALRTLGYQKYVTAKTIGSIKREFGECLDGIDNAPDLDKRQKAAALGAEDESTSALSLSGKAKTVAFCGTQTRIGTTTQAIQFAKYLQTQGLHVCYIENNQNGHIPEYLEVYDVKEHNQEKSLIRLSGLDLYYDTLKLPLILQQPYDVFLYDCGVLSPANAATFLDKDLSVIVGGSMPWELNYFVPVLDMLIGKKDIQYIFSFTSKTIRPEILKNMKRDADMTFFAEYSPDPFTLLAGSWMDWKACYSRTSFFCVKTIHSATTARLSMIHKGIDDDSSPVFGIPFSAARASSAFLSVD
jgi:hypothetical protein